jgi:hypothetical protein
MARPLYFSRKGLLPLREVQETSFTTWRIQPVIGVTVVPEARGVDFLRTKLRDEGDDAGMGHLCHGTRALSVRPSHFYCFGPGLLRA